MDGSETRRALLAIADVDKDRLSALAEAIPSTIVDPNADETAAMTGGLAFAAFASDDGRAALERLNTRRSLHGLAPAMMIDFREDGTAVQHSSANATAALFAKIGESAHMLAARNVDLMRQAAQIRHVNEETLYAFEKLERFVTGLGGATRTERLSLLPSPRSITLSIESGQTLVQRLPIGSAGLSDIAILVANAPTAHDGHLQVDVRTADDNALAGAWLIPARELAPGWHRLALPSALSGDQRSVLVALSWVGPSTVELRCALRHPESRMQASVDGRAQGLTLAIKAWTFVEGCEAPVAVGSRLPASELPERSYVPGSMLEQAESLNAKPENVEYKASDHSVLVHVLIEGVSVARIPGAAVAGTRIVSARALTRSEKAPVAEYALGVAPAAARPQTPGTPPEFAPGRVTEWLTLTPMESGRLDLVLDAPVDEPLDLYLMTRLHPSAKRVTWGWTTFDQIRLERRVLLS